jgi:RecA/RadA recombinase
MSLLDKMLKAGSVKGASILAESKFFAEKDPIQTELPIVNIAFSGSLKGGLIPGLTVIAGASKSFKTLLSLYCMKAYLNKYKDGVAILYDSEYGITPEYLESYNIDTDRVIHVPIEDVEQLKFDITKRLNEVEKGDRVFVMIDSIGNLASRKEVEDAENEKSVADMSRAKQLKSLFRIITPKLTGKDIPCLAVNHTYKEISMFPKDIVSGGTGIYYSANQIFIITKAQEKDGTELAGFKFTINIEKSRFVKEKSKLPFTVLYDSGIQKWSSLFDLALESGHLTIAKQGWYNMVNMKTGEVIEPKMRAKDIEQNDEFFENLVKDPKFNEFIEKKYKLTVADQREALNAREDDTFESDSE